MPIDPNILLQGAQLQIASRNQLSNDLDNALKLYTESKKNGLDFDKLVQRSALNAASGNASPQDLQILQAQDILKGPQTQYQRLESGEIVPMGGSSIMDRVLQMGAKTYAPSYPPFGNVSPTPQQPTGALSAIPALTEDQLNTPIQRMGANHPAALTQQQQEALSARGDVMNRPAMPLPQITPPVGAGPKTIQAAQEANVELSKTAAQIPLKGQIAQAEKSGQLAAESIQKNLDAAKKAGNLFIGIDEAEKYLKDATGGLGPYIGNKIKGIRGQSDEQTQANAKLKLVSGWMVSNVPRMEGPQSNFDVENYKTMAADVGNELLPIGDRIAALKSLRFLQEKYSGQGSNTSNTNGKNNQTQTSVDSLPNSAVRTDKTSGGKPVYRSQDGKFFVMD